MGALTVVNLSEPDQVRLLSAVEWTDWTRVQSLRFPPGKGATSFLRSAARALGLAVDIQRAGDIIYLTLRWPPIPGA